jgi:PKHD-type hydroxylase
MSAMHIPQVLNSQELSVIREILANADWQCGKSTAGQQSVQVKHNQQLEENNPVAEQARAIIMQALGRHALFFTSALPKKIFPPMFNRYTEEQNYFGNHIDNAVRTSRLGMWVRTDLSATLFLCNPDEYEGGELVIEDNLNSSSIKLSAGDMVLYPSTHVHRVEPVLSGARIASFFWIESMVQNLQQRQLLLEMDLAINSLKNSLNNSNSKHTSDDDSQEVVRLTGCYHNLLRMWAQP